MSYSQEVEETPRMEISQILEKWFLRFYLFLSFLSLMMIIIFYGKNVINLPTWKTTEMAFEYFRHKLSAFSKFN